MEVGRSELGTTSTWTVPLGMPSLAGTVPVIRVSWAPPAPVTCPVAVALNPVIPTSEETVRPACSSL